MFTIFLGLFVISLAFSVDASERCQPLGKFKADPENVHKFYQCTVSGWQQFICPGNLVFNEVISVCDWPVPDNEFGQNEHHDSNTTFEPCDVLSELKPDPKDCNKFYECTNYGWQSMTCPKSLYFNPALNECDYSYNVECNNE